MKQISEPWQDLGAGKPWMTSSDDSAERVNRVWASLTATFGDRFSREFGSEPSPEWAGAVARLSDEEVVRGLRNLAEDGRAHPPNLSEFVAACRRTDPVRYLGVKTDQKLLEAHSGVSQLCRTGLLRIAGGHPEHRGKICSPFSLPHRPPGVGLLEWLRTTAPKEDRDYCRAGVEWTRRNRAIALPGFIRLVAEIDRGRADAPA